MNDFLLMHQLELRTRCLKERPAAVDYDSCCLDVKALHARMLGFARMMSIGNMLTLSLRDSGLRTGAEQRRFSCKSGQQQHQTCVAGCLSTAKTVANSFFFSTVARYLRDKTPCNALRAARFQAVQSAQNSASSSMRQKAVCSVRSVKEPIRR